MRSSVRPYHLLDAQELGLLPEGWQTEIADFADKHEIKTVLTGQGSTSRERSAGQSLTVYVVGGRIVSEKLGWLWNLYTNEFRAFAEEAFQKPLYTANDVQSGVNINVLKGQSARYEWHVDSNPVTGLLFVTNAEKGDGGSLVFRSNDGRTSMIRPRSGLFACFDARDLPHRVAPLRSSHNRISIPMNYYDSRESQPRPADLDDQIYTPAWGEE